jgi:predicted transposase/invertase (TIGR01784 family)
MVCFYHETKDGVHPPHQTKERSVAMAENNTVTSYTDANGNIATSYKEATGKITYGMTNDYMFKIVLESNLNILKALICALLHLVPTDAITIHVENPITPGASIGDKGFVLDIKVLMNGKIIINLEMQLTNLGNWIDRSLDYLCRSYDNLLKGQDYDETMEAIHIGFLNFTLFDGKPEFYATYKMMNVKNSNIYSDKFTLGVVDLSKIEMATEEDKAYGIDKWAKLFKATTWEELKSMAAQNAIFDNVAQSMFMFSCDANVMEQCRRVEDHKKFMAYQDKKIKSLEASNIEKDSTIANMGSQLADMDNQLADMGSQLADMGNHISELEAQIAALKAELVGK